MQARTYAVGRSSITLRFGDITRSKAEAIVSSDDYLLSMGGGVSAALRKAGGPRVSADASKLVPAAVGDVLVASAGDLPAKYILHAVTLGRNSFPTSPATIVRQTSQRAMRLLPVLGCKSIAFPAIGAGVAGIPYETVAAEMATVLVGAALDAEVSYSIELYLMDRFDRMRSEDFFVFFEQFAARQLGLAPALSGEGHALDVPPRATADMDPELAAQAQRRHAVFSVLRRLDASRNKLEAELLRVLESGLPSDAARLSALTSQLEQLQALRRGYEAEIASADARPTKSSAAASVFVSSTSSDLAPHRAAVRSAIEGIRLKYVGMEDFGAVSQLPADLIRQKVRDSGAFLGILGMRYGHVDTGTGMSMTELEYTQARASGMPVHMFVMDERAPITCSMVDSNPEHYARLVELKRRVTRDHTCKMFIGPQDLADKARDTLASRAA